MRRAFPRLYFTPLEKATDEIGGRNRAIANGGLMSPLVPPVSPVRNFAISVSHNGISNGVKESSLTGFTSS